MKINVEPQTCAAVQCLQDDCPWKKVCANHASAGDFRTEGGYRPVLKLQQGEVFCDSFHMQGSGEWSPYNDCPSIEGGRPFAVQGCCDCKCVLWSELAEVTNAYEI